MTQQEKANRMIRELRQNIIASVLLIGNLEDLMHIHSEIVYLSMCKTDADGNMTYTLGVTMPNGEYYLSPLSKK